MNSEQRRNIIMALRGTIDNLKKRIEEHEKLIKKLLSEEKEE